MRVFKNRLGVVLALALGSAVAVAAAPSLATGNGDYSVLFTERDGQTFSNSGDTMIQLAVRRIQARHATKVELVGHANCYETDPMELSRLRAERVAEALVAAGINRELIEIRFVGGREPGVGSAMNRRVDIYIGTENG